MFLNTTYVDMHRFYWDKYSPARSKPDRVDFSLVADSFLPEDIVPTMLDWLPGPSHALRLLPALDDESGNIFDYCTSPCCHFQDTLLFRPD